MPELPDTNSPRPADQEVWLESLANLGKRLVAPPPVVSERAPAGDER